MTATAKAEKRRRSSKRPAEAASGSADSPAASTRSKKRRGKQPAEDPSPVVPARLAEDGPSASAEEGSPPIEEVEAEEEQQVEVRQLSPKKRAGRPNRPNRDDGEQSRLVGSPIPMNEARRRWPDRYKAQANAPGSAQSSDEEEILHVKRHYRRAIVDGVTYSLYDNAYVKTNGTTTLLTLQDFNMASLIPLASGSQDVVAGIDAGVADAVQLVGVSDSVAVDQAAFVFCDGGLSCELVEIIFDVNGVVDGVAVGMSLLSSLPLADDGVADYIGRIVEFFETTIGKLYFTAQWFYRAEDTVMKNHTFCHATKVEHDPRRVFLSEDKNNNPLDCIVSKIQIVRLAPNIDLTAKKDSIPPCDLYYDMSYSMSYSTFANLPPENGTTESESSSTICSEGHPISTNRKAMSDSEESSSGEKNIVTLLDLYSGCGAMSTGLCLGANLSGINLQTSWAVDLNPFACQSLQLNHPGTEVRNENAEHFLRLLKEWVILCGKYDALGNQNFLENESNSTISDEESGDSELERDEFEVEKLLDICYGDPSDTGDVGLKFKVRWKGYDSSYDTWEPLDGLSNCEERIVDFVRQGYRKNILPLPGRVDVICGGPPCQGISGFNRFRNKDAPLEDPKNKQMLIFMDIVEFLKPKYVLMENVVDILKFAQGFLGRYALSRLVAMNYQARLGIMAAGSYGLPQFRMRVFLWGALPTEVLPQFPLPTHDVKVRGGAPNEFEQNMVAYNENESPDLSRALFLEDAISDLPSVTNYEIRDEMKNDKPPRTEFQHSIRLSRIGTPMERHQLFDHRPLQLNEDDYQRVCQIPKRKGANFRDLPGVLVGPDNKVEWDPNVERILLPSGKPLVPDYAMSFIRGKSPKPFGRLWWDETVPTVVTRAEPHNQIILHPEQDRVLTIRENARLQGFPDYYQLVGPVKERYIQVGNAVAMPVSRALGYAFGRAYHGQFHSNPVLVLPADYPVAAEPAESAD